MDNVQYWLRYHSTLTDAQLSIEVAASDNLLIQELDFIAQLYPVYAPDSIPDACVSKLRNLLKRSISSRLIIGERLHAQQQSGNKDDTTESVAASTVESDSREAG